MLIDRRTFLVTAAAATAGACVSRRDATTPLRVLMLGGTNFVGAALVQEALDRGHRVTMFNRGKTNPQFFADVEKLRGDRLDRENGLRALEGRTWDIVLDTWATAPAAVSASVSALKGRAGHYVYISSIAVYGRYRDVGIREDARTVNTSNIADPWDVKVPYALAKRRAEQHLEEQFERHTILRATSINGRDPSGVSSNQQVYWPIRLARGGEVLAPGDGRDPMQYVDVKDLARFAISAAERDRRGIYNTTTEPLGMQQYLTTVQKAAPATATSTLTWVATNILLREGVAPFDHLPTWIPLNDPEPGFYQISNARAVAGGFTYRPLIDTVRDVYASYPTTTLEPNVAGGMSRERERELLTKWARLSQNSGV